MTHLLIVDDNPDITTPFKYYLTGHGMRVISEQSTTSSLANAAHSGH